MATLSSDGQIVHYHLAKNKILSENNTHRDNNVSLTCGDYTRDGRRLIVGGSDRLLYVYDERERALEATLHGKNLKIAGHQNRIFGIKCHPHDSNLFVTCGWDRSVKIYDVRTGGPVASMGGPVISGDSIDIHDDMIVTGSNRNKDVMQVFSLSQQKRIYTFDYS